MDEYKDKIELIDYLNVIWKRKWIILIPTLFFIVLAFVISFVQPPKWEIDAIIVPSKFLVQTQQGQFIEVVVVEPKQIASQINEETYNDIIATELKIDIREFPELRAESIPDTKLIRISTRENNVERAKLILNSLFDHLKKDLDKKIDVEIKEINAQIITKENLIKQDEISIKDHQNLIEQKKLEIEDNENKIKTKENEIKKQNNNIKLKELEAQSKEIEKDRLKKEIESSQNKIKISEDRVKSITDEMKSVKKRIDELEELQKKALAEKKEGNEAMSLLLYSNEVQSNLRYYNTLDEKVSREKNIQENLSLDIRDNEQQLRQIDNQIEQTTTQKETIKAEIENILTEIAVIKTEIEKIKNTIDTEKNEIEKVKNTIDTEKTEIKLLEDKKARIDYTQIIKQPTRSLYPVSPKKKLNMLISAIVGLLVFTMLAFFLEYLEKQKVKNKG